MNPSGSTPDTTARSETHAPAAQLSKNLTQQLGADGAHHAIRLLAAFALGGVAGSGVTAKVMYDRAESERSAMSATPGPMPADTTLAPPAIPKPPSEPVPSAAPPNIPSARPPASHPHPSGAALGVGAPQQAAPAKPPAGSGDLARQRLLLEQARVALGRGDPDAALAAIGEHARQFPATQLGEERDLLRIQALRYAGDFAAVRAEAKVFHERYPQSVFAPKVEAILEGIP
jgi:hypothetical protein